MGDLSQHFSRHEFECHGVECCGHSAPVCRTLIAALEAFRADIGGPLKINSGFRCLTHNRSIGSKDTSQHPRGTAADIDRAGRDVYDMRQIADRYFSKVIIYDWGIHCDVR